MAIAPVPIFRYPAVVLLAATLTGTVIGREYAIMEGVVISLSAAALLIMAYTIGRPRHHLFIVAFFILIAGVAYVNAAFRYQSNPADDIGRMVGRPEKILFFGCVDKWPAIKQHKTLIVCRIDSAAVGESLYQTSGRVLINLRRESTRFALGDRIAFSGRLTKPQTDLFPGSFDYGRYLDDKGIRGLVYLNDPARILVNAVERNLWGRTMAAIRQSLLTCFTDRLSPPSAALASGFLVGETRDISGEVYQAFRRSGTLHLLAVSGSNVAAVLIIMVILLRLFHTGKNIRLWILLTVIVIFSHLAHNEPSVIRASLMAVLVLLARTWYRRADLNNIIAAAAAILIFYDPGNLFDIGFQLSFAVTWGLVLFLPGINQKLTGLNLPAYVRYPVFILSCSLIASLVSAPITAAYFGNVSLVTPISNLVVVPLVSIGVTGILILLLVSLVFPPLAFIPAAFLDRLLILTNDIVLWFGRLELASVTAPGISGLAAIFAIVAISLVFFSLTNLFARRWLVLATLAAIIVYCVSGIVAGRSSKPLIEIYNHGDSQHLVINVNGGMVVWRDNRTGNFDDFTRRLLPSLARSDSDQPSYYLFLEPTYRTLRRLENAAELFPELSFRPVSGQVAPEGPTVWTVKENAQHPAESFSAQIGLAPGLVQISIADSVEIIVVDDVSADQTRFRESNAFLTWKIVFVGPIDKAPDLLCESDISHAVVIPDSYRDAHNILNDSMLSGFCELLGDRLILPAHYLSIGYETVE